MPCRSIEECIQFAISTGPVKQIIPRIRNELKDYFAHKFMIFAGKRKLEDQQLLIELFKYLFNEKE